MSEQLPPQAFWMQQSLVPVEHHVIRLRLGANKRQGTASMGLRIEDGDTDELIGMWAGPVIPIESLEAKSALMLGVALMRCKLLMDDVEPF